LLRQHWADPLLSRIPFIVYTATYTDPKDEQLALGLGADSFVLKPSEPEELVARLKQFLEDPAIRRATASPFPASTPAAVAPAESPGEAEGKNLRLYSQVLVHKLADKAEELDTANRKLQQNLAEHRLTEEALRREEALFTDLANTIPDHIYFKDRQSRFIRINLAMARALGFRNAAEAVGKSDFDVFGEEHAQQAFADEQRIMETGEPMIGFEEKETWPDGHVT
jgi:PAS domain S-box-containing protein